MSRLSSILAVIIMLLTLGQLSAEEQYSPTTFWPYIYENFQEGTIYLDGGKKTTALLNIHLYGLTAQYVDKDGKVCDTTDPKIVRVEIGKDIFLPIDGRMIEAVQVSKSHDGKPLCLVYNRQGIFTGLGATLAENPSLTASSLGVMGLDQQRLDDLAGGKKGGVKLKVTTSYAFYCEDHLVPATEEDVMAILNYNGQQELRAFIKIHKVKWNKPESLMHVLHFLAGRYDAQIEREQMELRKGKKKKK